MKIMSLIIGLLILLTSCSPQKAKTTPELVETTQQTNATTLFQAEVTDLEKSQLNQILRNKTCQEQGIFILNYEKLYVYKKYMEPNPNLSPEKLIEAQEKIIQELKLTSFEEFEEIVEQDYIDCQLSVEGPFYHIKAADFEETFEKIGLNRVKDSKGVEYEVLK